jgi:hypothetical protein
MKDYPETLRLQVPTKISKRGLVACGVRSTSSNVQVKAIIGPASEQFKMYHGHIRAGERKPHQRRSFQNVGRDCQAQSLT